MMEWRPIFPMVFIGFWAYVQPRWIGAVVGLLYGYVVEQMAGLNTGVYAIPTAILALSISGNYLRFRIYPTIQQAFYVFVISLIGLGLGYFIASWGDHSRYWALALCGAISTSVLWLILVYVAGNALVQRTAHA